MNSDKSEFLGTAFRAAMLAGFHILENLGRISKDDIDTKRASDFVTRADKEAEQIILKTIKHKFPDHHFLAEESIKEVDTGEYRWIIDPLDGTTNFIHEYPVFSVSIALEYKSDVVLGVVYDPLRDELFTAEKGKGAFLNGKPLRVSLISDLSKSLVATGFPFRKKELIDPYLDLFKNIFHRVSDIRRAGSAALDLAYLASGRCDGFFEIGLSPWDIAAGSLLITEAGGIITDFGGGQDYLFTGNIVSGNRVLHGEILKEVKGIFRGKIDK
ncbi:MAG: inositol monophosphatase [Candidatus Omnitrophica bacterium]|nr:inositol monophosphatase [Candidatus Omnitrophota bacterium]